MNVRSWGQAIQAVWTEQACVEGALALGYNTGDEVSTQRNDAAGED